MRQEEIADVLLIYQQEHDDNSNFKECGCQTCFDVDRILSQLPEINLEIRTNFELVWEFHETFAPTQIAKDAAIPQTGDLIDLRVNLIDEEVQELKEALDNSDIIEVADALADLLYVTYGAALAFGINIDEVFLEVHRSNMSKLGTDGKPIYREDGKVLKGPNYQPPDIKKILFGESP